jgi:hypothetical protein
MHLAGRRLVIRYRSGMDEISSREISDIRFEPPSSIYAHCHLRGEARTFDVGRVLSAADPATGELLDIRAVVGLPPLEKPRRELPTFPLPEKTSSHRSEEKRRLFAHFKLEVIANAKRRALRQAFNDAGLPRVWMHRAALLAQDAQAMALQGNRLRPVLFRHQRHQVRRPQAVAEDNPEGHAGLLRERQGD